MDNIIISGLAGGSAGIIADIIFFPIETIKIRIQASNKKVDYSQTAKSVNKYKGLLSQVAVSFPYAFIFFSTYDSTKKYLSTITNLQLAHMLAGASGEFVSNLFKNPFEVVKNQMQVGLDSRIRETIHSIYKLQGLRGFYAGFNSIILREIPFSAIQFPIYELMKSNFGNDGFAAFALNGFVAGGIAAFLTTPCDVIKSKLMTQRKLYYSNIFDCVRSIQQEDGFLGFWRAAHYRTLQISISGIVFFSSYEKCKMVYGNMYNN